MTHAHVVVIFIEVCASPTHLYVYVPTHSYVWHLSFIRVTCLDSHSYMYIPTHSYVWHDSFIHVCSNSFIRVAWFIHTCDMSHSYASSGSVQPVVRSQHIWDQHMWGQHIWGHRIWGQHMCDVTFSCAVVTYIEGCIAHRIEGCIAFRLIHTCDMTHSCVWHNTVIRSGNLYWRVHSTLSSDAFIRVTWPICLCDIIHSYAVGIFIERCILHYFLSITSFVTKYACLTWLIYLLLDMCAMTHSSIHATWLIHLYMWLDSFIHTCDMTHSSIHVTRLIHAYMWRDSFMCSGHIHWRGHITLYS